MSHRSGKKRKKDAKDGPKPESESPKKSPFAVLRRRRVTLAAVAGLLTMLLIAALGGRQPPRITVINRTGEPIIGLRIDFPGGSVEAPTVPDGGKGSLLLRPDPADPKPPGSGPITLTYRVGDQSPRRFFSRVHGQDYGAHDVITINRQPDGRIVEVPSPPGGWGVRFRDLFRRIGINL